MKLLNKDMYSPEVIRILNDWLGYDGISFETYGYELREMLNKRMGYQHFPKFITREKFTNEMNKLLNGKG